MTQELRGGKIKKIAENERGIAVTVEKEVRMSKDFLRMRYRVLNEGLQTINEEIARIEEIAKKINLTLY